MVVLKRALLIVNPASRRGSSALPQAERALARAQIDCDVRLTVRAGDAERLAREHAATFDAVFSLGGDGTVMEVLRGVMGTETAVGALPGGTGNLVSRALGIPMSVRRAVNLLAQGESRRIDLGQLSGGRVFAFAAGIGVDVAMLQRTSVAAKRRFGVLAYVRAAANATLALDRFTLVATVDGVEHRLPATLAMVANFGSVLGGMIRLGPGIVENDGMLDLCVFSPASVPDAFRLGWRLLRRNFGTDPSMHYFRGRTMLLNAEPPRATQADGELLPEAFLHVTVAPLAARMLVPPLNR